MTGSHRPDLGELPDNDEAPKYQSTAIISNAHRILKHKYKGLPLWVLVRDLWGVGSARAADIAREAGYDPHQVCGKHYLRKP